MKIFLTLKSWQIFLIVWGIPFLTVFIPLEAMSYVVVVILTLFMGISLFLWVYAIGTYLPEKINKDIKLPTKQFRIHIWILILIVVLGSFAFYFKETIESYFGIIFLAIVYYFVAVLIILRYVSKVIASLELNRLAKLSDYIGYIFLFWFSPIGIWIIQPKVRKFYLK